MADDPTAEDLARDLKADLDVMAGCGWHYGRRGCQQHAHRVAIRRALAAEAEAARLRAELVESERDA